MTAEHSDFTRLNDWHTSRRRRKAGRPKSAAMAECGKHEHVYL